MRIKNLFILGICSSLAVTLLDCSGGGSGGGSAIDTSQLKGSWQQTSLQLKNENAPRSADNNGYVDVSESTGPNLQKLILSFDGSSNLIATNILKSHPDDSDIVNANYKISGNKLTFIFPDLATHSQVPNTIRKVTPSTLELVGDEDNSVAVLTRISDDKVSEAQSELKVVRGMPPGSPIGCYAISDDIAQLSSVLSATSNCTSHSTMTLDEMSQADWDKACPGDVILCAGEAAFWGNQTEKAAALKAVNQVEESVGDLSPSVTRAFEGLKSALGSK